jgi:predicted HTH transcriptional regulator
LERVQAVKAAIHGKPKKPRGARPSEAAGRSERIASAEAWVASVDNGRTFSGRELANDIEGVSAQGIAPVMLNLVKRGIVKEVGTNEDGRKTYQRA